MKALATLVFTFFITTTFSQNGTPNRLLHSVISKIEIVGGSGLLKNTGYLDNWMVPKNGYSYGIGVYHTFTPHFELNFRTTFDLKGSNVDHSYHIIDATGTHNYHYTITSNFKYLTFSLLPTFMLGPKQHWILGFGGFLSVLKSADVTKVTTENGGDTSVQYLHALSDFPDSDKIDMGYSVLTGYRFKFIGKSIWTLHAMYNKSVSDVNDGINFNQRHRTIMLMLSVALSTD